MPSTVVHLAFAGMIAAALLGTEFDRRALLAVFAITAFPDLDSFVALVASVGHRTVFHTLLIPIALGALLWVDTRLRSTSLVRRRWGARGVRIAWVGLCCYALAGIGLDLFSVDGANPLWPLHDQFYEVDGRIELSSQRGIVQTFVESPPDGGGAPAPPSLGSSAEHTVTTGVDPGTPPDDEPVDRVFPIVRAGWQLLLLLAGTAVTAARFAVSQDARED